MTTATQRRAPGEVTRDATALVAERTPEARALGQRLGELLWDPDTFADALRDGLAGLADPAYRDGQQFVAPGVGETLGVRTPLLRAVEAGLKRSLREASPAVAVYLAERLIDDPLHEVRLFGHVPVLRALQDDPERSWQLIRRLARRATDWVSVDSLADVAAIGILLEEYRWAEIEQLVFSPHRWERRLVAATIARLPYQLEPHGRASVRGAPALEIVRQLLGDAEPDVQKALSWALRSWMEVDPEGTTALIREEATTAASQRDGHRAWVLRDALSAQPPEVAESVRRVLEGIRRRADDPSTSRAGAIAAEFALPDAHAMAEPPLR